jgi:hypothetical protein
MTLKQLQAIKLSEHFRASEIFYSVRHNIITLSENPKVQKIQFFLAESICQNLLEDIREIAVSRNYQSMIRILGGCRNKETHLKMYSTNWIAPSITSDHSYMNDYYSLGVGAVDFGIPIFKLKEMRWLFNQILEYFDGSQYGQVIFYPDSESKFIHISNPKSILGKVGEKIKIPDVSKKMIYENGNYSCVRL